MIYPPERLQEEVVFLAYHFHWSYREILSLEHAERRRFCEEISKIHRRLAEPQD